MTGKDVYLQMTWSWPDKTWNILCSYCLQWNTSQSKFRNHYFLFLFAFSILSQLFLIWGCICICVYVCVYIYIYIYIYMICIYLYYFYVLLLVLSVCTKGLRVTQFQFSVCMYGTCGRIDNKSDFDLWLWNIIVEIYYHIYLIAKQNQANDKYQYKAKKKKLWLILLVRWHIIDTHLKQSKYPP